MTLNKLEKLRLKQFVNLNGSENINSKIAALFAAAVMITAGFVIVADVTDSDAKVVDDDYEAIHIKEGVSHNVTLFTDEFQYVNYGYTLTWYIAGNSNAFNAQTNLDEMEFTDKLGTRTGEAYVPVTDGVKIGNFVEIKNSTLGEKTSVAHLTYIGDSDFGSHINVGCGVVTVNYNGYRKFRSTVDDHAFIGCNTNLVSPVHVGENAYIAAGSTITGDVGAQDLAIARARQVNKPGWAAQYREKQLEEKAREKK